MDEVDSKNKQKSSRTNRLGRIQKDASAKATLRKRREGGQYNKGGVRGEGVKTENVKTRVRVGRTKRGDEKVKAGRQVRESRGCGLSKYELEVQAEEGRTAWEGSEEWVSSDLGPSRGRSRLGYKSTRG